MLLTEWTVSLMMKIEVLLICLFLICLQAWCLPDIIVTSDQQIVGPRIDMLGVTAPNEHNLKQIWEFVSREDYVYFLGNIAVDFDSSVLYDIAKMLLSVSDITPQQTKLGSECVSLRVGKLLSLGCLNEAKQILKMAEEWPKSSFEIKRTRLYQLLYQHQIEEASSYVLDQVQNTDGKAHAEFWSRAKTVLNMLQEPSSEAQKMFQVQTGMASCVSRDPLGDIRAFVDSQKNEDIKKIDPLTLKLILHLDAMNPQLLANLPTRFYSLLWHDPKWKSFGRDVKLHVAERLASLGAIASKELLLVYETSFLYGLEINREMIDSDKIFQELLKTKGHLVRAFLYQELIRDQKFDPVLLRKLIEAFSVAGLLQACARDLVSLTEFMLPTKEFKESASARLLLLLLGGYSDRDEVQKWIKLLQGREDRWCAIPYYLLIKDLPEDESTPMLGEWYRSNTSNPGMEKVMLSVALLRPELPKRLTCPHMKSEESVSPVALNSLLQWTVASGRLGSILGAVVMRDKTYNVFHIVEALSSVKREWANRLAIEYILKPWSTLKQ